MKHLLDLEHWAEKTEGWSGADIQELISQSTSHTSPIPSLAHFPWIHLKEVCSAEDEVILATKVPLC